MLNKHPLESIVVIPVIRITNYEQFEKLEEKAFLKCIDMMGSQIRMYLFTKTAGIPMIFNCNLYPEDVVRLLEPNKAPCDLKWEDKKLLMTKFYTDKVSKGYFEGFIADVFQYVDITSIAGELP